MITSLAELKEQDSDWQKHVYELDTELSHDVPSLHPFVPAPFPQYAQREFEDPNFMPESWFMALYGEQYIGLTLLVKANDNVELLQTAFTAVRRDYRRHGIATALKVRSFQFAQQIGTRLIRANNEENNPMFQLNLLLGFQPQPADVDWEKRVSIHK